MDRISDFKSRVSAQSTDWRNRLREKVREIRARKVTPMEDQEQHVIVNDEPELAPEANEEQAAEAKDVVFTGEDTPEPAPKQEPHYQAVAAGRRRRTGGGGIWAAGSGTKNEDLRGMQAGAESRREVGPWQLVGDSDRAAGTANLLLTIGPAAAVAGGLLIGADFLFASSDRPQIRAAVIPPPAGVGVVVGFHC